MNVKVLVLTCVSLLIVSIVGGRALLTAESGDEATIMSRMSAAVGGDLPARVAPTPSPFPFQDLTIPYLRQQSFPSQLGALERWRSASTHTSYLTHYTSDGLKINALLTKPTGEQPESGWPAIIFVHGYIPPTQYRTTEKYEAYVDGFARSGFVVMKIDLRGHGESEGEASGAYYASEYIRDVLSAHSALAGSEFVDPQAIGLWGHSMAGNVVLRAMAVRPEIPAVVVWAGAVFSYEDFMKYGIEDGSYRPPAQLSARQSRRQELFAAHGTFATTSAFWQQVAPTNYLSDLKGAIQLHHPVDDLVVPIDYSRDLAQRLETAGVTHQFFEYPTGGHNISGSSFGIAMRRSVEFFQTHLGVTSQ